VTNHSKRVYDHVMASYIMF